MDQPGPDAILAGRYRLIRQLGRGGMGTVWHAQHLSLDSPVAIKLIDPEIASNPEALARFLREARAAAALRSPHVVQILDHGVDNDVPYIAMELLEGDSLAQRLERLGRLTSTDTARVLTHVGRALLRAHEAGIVHRDLKPENIFLIRNDEEEIAKVLDFGIAKATLGGLAASASGSTRTGALLGTPYYMSPEQAEGIRSLDHRTDVWAMGVIAFECIVGRRPFDTETIGSLLLAICSRPMPVPSQLGAVPPGFDAWFARACARDLNQRFPSAKEAATELRLVCGADAPVSNERESSGASSRQPSLPQPNPRISAQSVVGLATTNGKNSNPAPRESRSRSAITLALVAFATIGGGVLAWMRLGASGATSTAPTAQTLVASVSIRGADPTVASSLARLPDPEAFASSSALPSATAAPRAVAVTALPRVPSPVPPAPAAMSRPAQMPPKASAQPAAPPHAKVNLGF